NRFLGSIKRKYGIKKAGFSGTLDPFASGVLIVAFGQYTKLFRFLDKTPKRYRATLWLGAYSPTLDIEKVESVQSIMPFAPESIEIASKGFLGDIEYLPPKYCAKKVDGKRAYALARNGEDFELKKIKSTIYDFKILHYCHPFLTFEIAISEGGYIRSIGSLLAKRFGFDGCLSSLERLSEGRFVYDDERALNPLEYLNVPDNSYLGDMQDVELGRVLHVEMFEKKERGIYKITSEGWFSVVEICEDNVKYLLNRIVTC
ncbi:MAG: tRNA pseudouridine(55) synthase TruB, partial [Sulfurospirillaceae bacterium]|nr:tRNA pseudouridine(55) synthase TruB [Sulfurospirillaceae bacterium]